MRRSKVFKFIGRLFGANKVEPVQEIVRSSFDSNQIKYNPDLIRELEDDHKQLVADFGKIWSEGFEKKDYAKTNRLITNFKGAFQAHLLAENIKFYVYLEQTLKGDPENLHVVKEFRLDMNKIARAATNFCKRYQVQFTTRHVEQFENDYKKVGKVLTQRITLEEESLYVLYKPR